MPESPTPESWRRIHFSILFKSGDASLPQHYIPIYIIPLKYKLFPRLLYNRLEPLLDKFQPPKQARIRKNYSTGDHLFALTILIEKGREWQIPIWAATLDFKKASDTVYHDALWKALEAHSVPAPRINMIAKLYTSQTAVVKTDALSR